MTIFKGIRHGAAAGMLFTLASCMSLDAFQPEENTRYVLSAPDVAAATPARGDFHLVVEYPSANPGVAGNRIILEREPNRMDYVAESRWAGDLPSLVQTSLVESLNRSALFASVSPNVRYQGATLVLRVDIQAFQAVYRDAGATPVAVVRLAFQLMDLSRRAVVRSGIPEASVAASSARLQDIMKAFDAAYAATFTELLRSISDATNTNL